MIAARTGMERMPEHCTECRERRCSFTVQGTRYCRFTSRTIPDTGRPDWCPLVEIDETLPAQLECAEARIRKLDRLLNFEEVHTPDEHH